MPDSSFPPEQDLVLRLRAAGCVFAEEEARLLLDAAASPERLADLLNRRVDGEPLEYILGRVEFCGLRLAVEEGVFVPRQRTEFLVREAASFAPTRAVVLDLCCGTGALGLALASLADVAELHAADIEAAAVRCARGNMATLGPSLAGRRPFVSSVAEGDLFDPLPPGLAGRVDVLLANVPYVPTEAIATMPPEAREHEPLVTLDGGADGLDVLRRVAADAPRWLRPGGSLLVEASEEQAPAAADVFATSGLRARVAESEEFSATVVVGTRP